MTKQVYFDQLFNRDFDNYQKDTSTQFDVAMEKKIKRMQWFNYLKWILGVVIIGGLLIATLVLINKDGKADQAHQEPIELSKSLEIKKERDPPNKSQASAGNGKANELDTQNLELKDGNLMNMPHQVSNEESIIPTEKNGSTVIFSLHSNENFIENSRMFEFKEIPVSTESISIDCQLQRKELEMKNNSALASIPMITEKAKKQKEKRRKGKVKEEDITISSHLEPKVSYQKPKSRKKKISNQKVQNDASSALVLKTMKPKKEKTPSDFSGSIEFGFAPIYYKNMAAPYEPENDTVTVFIANKKPNASYDFGLEFLFKPVDSDWSIKTGLHYQQLNEEIDYYFRREYMDEELSYWQYDSIFEYNIDPPIYDTILVGVDSSYYEHWVLEENQKKHINQYSYLNIPILIGYQINFPSNRFKINALVGANMSILLQNQGYYYDTDGYILPYQNKQKAVINWAISAQMSVYYQWQKMSLYAKPSLQFQTKGKALDDYFEQRQYVIYGLEFGINLKLF